MTDHACRRYLKRKITMREHFTQLCDHICKLRLVSMVKRYRSYRRASFTRQASFWLAVNH